ncbi:hypothetical protein [Rhizobium beringeri]|uniref:hypothetical protein n=1 Tax=Rhizobium beringeri TaxID=3019934 RepID=UPI002E106208|nr:hypothetical protein U8P75_23980 [Rhizobium beringeri]WSH80198.1 hypothetical protein U8P69_23815 [Rhizobium beringeri]
MSLTESWRLASDKILEEMTRIAPEDRLKFLQEQVASLPGDEQGMVAHFVSLTSLITTSPVQKAATLSRHRHISLITGMALVVTVILAVAGVYLVGLRGDQGFSKINILGSSVETNSIGVACFALAGLIFLFVARKALTRI